MSRYYRIDIFLRLLCVVIAIAIATLCVAPSAKAAEDAQAEELIFEVLMLPTWSITEGIFAYQFEGRYYLPIVELGEAFEFYLDAETGRNYVTGFASQEENAFTIDGERGEITINGERRSLSSDAILSSDIVVPGDIYVQLEVLNEIWPVTMEVNLSALTIFVTAETELSFERKLDREKKYTILETKKIVKAQEAAVRYPYVKTPYHWFGKPTIDIQNEYTYDNREKELTGTNIFSGTQHLGKMVADYSASFRYNEEGKIKRPGSMRFRLKRQEVEDGGFLGGAVKRFETGDVSLRQRDLIDNSISGRGVLISNDISGRESEFDRITIEGVGPPGWEIELYNNDELIEFGEIEDNGEYRFEDVVLGFANNQIRVLLFGPQGQVREEVQNYQVSGSMSSPGELTYKIGLADADRPLILLENDPRTSPRGIAKSATAFYGVNRRITAFGSATIIPLPGDGIAASENQTYVTGGLAFSTPIGAGEVEAYKEVGGGNALDMRFITSLLGVRLNLRTAIFNHFDSPDTGYGDSAHRLKTEIQANRTVRLPFIPPLGLSLKVRHRELYSGSVFTDIDTTQSLTLGGIRLANRTTTKTANELHQTSSGAINSTVRIKDWQLRGAINYTLYPLMDLSSMQSEIRYKPKEKDWQAALNLQHNFLSSVSKIGGQLGYDFGTVLSSVDAEYQRERGWQFMARASTSINPYAEDAEYTVSSISKRRASPVRGYAFLDNNANNEFDDGDEPLEDVGLMLNRARSRSRTDAEGYVVANAPSDQLVNITIDTQTLIDPYFVPAIKGYSTIPLVGAMPSFNFPIVETGAIDGTAWYENGQPLEGIDLQLINEQGEIIQTMKTAYDGFYSFEFVPPGTYTVQVDPSYKVNVPPETVTVTSEDLFAFGIDLELLEQAEEARAVENKDTAGGQNSGEVAQTLHHNTGTEEPAPISSDDIANDPEPEPKAPPLVISGTVVKKVRIGEHQGKVRLVLDLSGPLTYDLTPAADGSSVIVDLPIAAWEAISKWRGVSTPVLQSFVVKALPQGGVRLTLSGRDYVRVGLHGVLPPAKGRGYRLYIDLHTAP